MQQKNQSGERVIRLVGLLFAFGGAVFLIISLIGLTVQSGIRKNGIQTMAVVTDVGENYTEIVYEADGQTFTSLLRYRSARILPGDSMSVYYDLQNPEKVFVDMPIFYLVFFASGILLSGLGGGILCRCFFKSKKTDKLRENGQRIYAEVIGWEKNYHLKRNYSYAKNLVCQYKTADGTSYLFKSDPFFGDVSRWPEGSQVPVYVERGNMDHYYVDLM